jgi:hypothetical protein
MAGSGGAADWRWLFNQYSQLNQAINSISIFRFDVLVNGGGAITLQFQRSPFRPQTKTVFVPWNQIVVLPPVQMQLNDNDEPSHRNFK